ncbi:MAG: hypothetical protein ACM3UZ_00285 [Acidobacteriota bacterium]
MGVKQKHTISIKEMSEVVLKRLVFFEGDTPNFEKRINDFIFDQRYKLLDITMLEWDRYQRHYHIGLLVEEQLKFFRQNCLVLEARDPEIMTKDLDDFSSVMAKAKNIEYDINFIKTFRIRTPRGEKYYSYVLYQD